MDNKITISRGFTRKVNLGNISKKFMYEAVDFFANYNEEFDKEGFTQLKAKEASTKLAKMAQSDVEDSIAKFLYDLIKRDHEEQAEEKFSQSVKYIKHDKIDKKAKALGSFIEDLDQPTND